MITPQLQVVLKHTPLTPDMKHYVSNLPKRYPEKFTPAEKAKFTRAVNKSQ